MFNIGVNIELLVNCQTKILNFSLKQKKHDFFLVFSWKSDPKVQLDIGFGNSNDLQINDFYFFLLQKPKLFNKTSLTVEYVLSNHHLIQLARQLCVY